MRLEEKLRTAVKQFHMLPRPAMKVIVGVSGGADSVALLHALLGLRENTPEVFVCHFNHLLRGRESDRDAAFVSALCEKHGLPFEVRSQDTGEFSKRKRLSTEHGARELRYGFFREVCERIGADRIATAHTMDDRAETVLMRIVRGSGSLGLSSIKPRSGNLIRPFLTVCREEVLDYLEATGEKWVEDSSNERTDFLRNRVRKTVIPLLEQGFNPRIKNALVRLADISSAHYSYISLQAEDAFAHVFPQRGAEFLAGSVSSCRSLHSAIRTEIFRMAFGKTTGGLERLEFSHIAEMDALLMSPDSGAVSLPRGVRMEKSRDFFCVCLAAGENRSISVQSEGVQDLPFGVRARFEQTTDLSMWGADNTGHFSLEKTGFPLEVRNFRPGDRVVPLGMKGSKKLKSVFSDKKIPSFIRRRLPVFTFNGDVIWAGGVVISDAHKAVKGQESLRVKLTGGMMEILNRIRRG